jgi:hypothetical protein
VVVDFIYYWGEVGMSKEIIKSEPKFHVGQTVYVGTQTLYGLDIHEDIIETVISGEQLDGKYGHTYHLKSGGRRISVRENDLFVTPEGAANYVSRVLIDNFYEKKEREKKYER